MATLTRANLVRPPRAKKAPGAVLPLPPQERIAQASAQKAMEAHGLQQRELGAMKRNNDLKWALIYGACVVAAIVIGLALHHWMVAK